MTNLQMLFIHRHCYSFESTTCHSRESKLCLIQDLLVPNSPHSEPSRVPDRFACTARRTGSNDESCQPKIREIRRLQQPDYLCDSPARLGLRLLVPTLCRHPIREHHPRVRPMVSFRPERPFRPASFSDDVALAVVCFPLLSSCPHPTRI